jgi:hypothetical protein
MAENGTTQTGNTLGSGDMAARDINKPVYNFGKTSFGGQSQLEKLYIKLEEEKKNSQTFTEIINELLHYQEYAKNTPIIGLEKKLENGNRLNYLEFAEISKEKFAKKILLNEHSESAQLIYAFLLAKVYTSFQTNIYSRLNEGHPEGFINQLITESIVKPLEELLGDNLLRIYDDEIYGMVYFLTDNCHIKWN